MNDTDPKDRIRTEHDRSEIHTTQHDWDGDDTLPRSVVAIVADVADVDPTDMTPLQRIVDADALDRIVAPRDGAPRIESRIAFTFEGYRVIVFGDGAIAVTEPVD